jgi:hypothetical protein
MMNDWSRNVVCIKFHHFVLLVTNEICKTHPKNALHGMDLPKEGKRFANCGDLFHSSSTPLLSKNAGDSGKSPLMMHVGEALGPTNLSPACI